MTPTRIILEWTRRPTPTGRAAERMKGPLRSRLVAPVLVCAAAAVALAWAGERAESRSYESPRVAGNGWAQVPFTARAAVSAAIGHDDPAFAVRRSRGGLVGQDQRQRIAFGVGRDGLLVRSGAARLRLSFVGVSRGGRFVPGQIGRVTWSANRIELNRGAVREWYVNGPLGVEQGFTVERRPLASARGSLALALRISGNVRASLAGSTGLSLSGPRGTALRYSGLSVMDARGRALLASLGVRPGRLTIRVVDAGARYPITIDPYVQQAELTESDELRAMLGYSVAIDGDTIVAGAPQAGDGGHNQQGAVYVFTKPATGWSDATPTAKLTASDGHSGDFLGASVAISGDTVVAGAPFSTGGVGTGTAYVFVKPASGWTNANETAKLTVSGGGFRELGRSVAVSGNTVVAGADTATVGSNAGQGAAYVFLKPNSGWHSETQNAELVASDGQANDNLGRSVAISGDTVVVGGGDVAGGTGAVYVFVRPGAGWPALDTDTAKLTSSAGQLERLGDSVAISGDTVVAGAPAAGSGSGVVYVFVEPAQGWMSETQTATLVASNAQANERLGESVAIDGDIIVAGAPGANQNQGAAYLFVRPPGGWVDSAETVQLTGPGENASPAVGTAVSISGQEIAAGAPGPELGASVLPGAVFLFAPAPPVTSVSLSPAAPNGRNGWYVSPVHVSVSASDDVSTVAQTRCELDPASPPLGFVTLPFGCGFSATGGDIAGDGAHSVYAASIDSAGDSGVAVGASFKIDRTPPALTCESPPTFVLGKPAQVTATVVDATSGPTSAIVAAPPNVSSAGHKTVTLTGFDNAGNSASVQCPYVVLAPRINARLNWGATESSAFTVLTQLIVAHTPSGTRIAVVCRGGGCPFTHRIVHAATSRLACKRHQKHCKRKPAAPVSNVNLLSPLAGRHLAVGAKLTITATEPQTIGEVWTLTIRASRAPRETGPTCLASGPGKPVAGC